MSRSERDQIAKVIKEGNVDLRGTFSDQELQAAAVWYDSMLAGRDLELHTLSETIHLYGPFGNGSKAILSHFQNEHYTSKHRKICRALDAYCTNCRREPNCRSNIKTLVKVKDLVETANWKPSNNGLVFHTWLINVSACYTGYLDLEIDPYAPHGFTVRDQSFDAGRPGGGGTRLSYHSYPRPLAAQWVLYQSNLSLASEKFEVVRSSFDNIKHMIVALRRIRDLDEEDQYDWHHTYMGNMLDRPRPKHWDV